MADLIAVINQKGGVGKTTTVHNICSYLGDKKKKVLAIDLDPQASLTIGSAVDPDENRNILSIVDGADWEDVIYSRPHYDLLPSSITLSEFDSYLSAKMGREQILKNILHKHKHNYDYVVIDCSPTLSLCTINALVATEYVLIPQQTEFFSMKGLQLILRSLDMIIENDLNNNIKLLGILLTMYDARKSLHKDVKNLIEGAFTHKTFKSIIRSNVDLASAPSHYKSIFDYAPKSNGAADYEKLSKEIIRRIKKGVNTWQPNVALA
tara:strand:- start:2362 stop:3156 length:795 start_codon:yes stop_codon:yes gene_type:complete